MTKKQFKKYMQEIIALKKDVRKVNDAFRKLDPDFNYFFLTRHEVLIVKM